MNAVEIRGAARTVGSQLNWLGTREIGRGHMRFASFQQPGRSSCRVTRGHCVHQPPGTVEGTIQRRKSLPKSELFFEIL
jgi:hypothetical protein